MNRRSRRRLLRPFIRAIGRLGRHFPRLALTISDLVAGITAPFRRHSPRRLRELFPHLSSAEASRLMREILARELRSQVITTFRKDSLARICRFDSATAAIERPFILGTFHIGPMFALGPLLATVEHDEAHIVRAYGGDLAGAREFHRALSTVKQAGSIAVPLDPYRASRMDVPFFDHRIGIARGAFALSRLSGAPILPALFVWRGHEIHLVLGEKVAVPRGDTPEEALEYERAAAGTVVRWLEQYLRGSLPDLGLRVVNPLRDDPT